MNNKVLVIEDDPDIAELLYLILNDAGCEIRIVADINYKESIKEQQPSLILLDYWLKNTNGDVICTNLKNDEDTKHIPIILISAVPHLNEKAIKCGADAWISKPFDISSLETTVSEWMKFANMQSGQNARTIHMSPQPALRVA